MDQDGAGLNSDKIEGERLKTGIRGMRPVRSKTGKAELGPLRAVRLGTAWVHVLTETQCVDIILDALTRGYGGSVLTMNLDILRRFQRKPECAEFYKRSDMIIADGKPIVWACRILGSPLPERVSGSNLICRLSAAAAREGRSVFLLGGMPGTAQKAASLLRARFAGLRVAGTFCPEMNFENTPGRVASILRTVSDARPDIVYVALGSPKQERLIMRLREVHPCAWYIGVGISFSFLSGHIRRAPLWMQKAGLEWIHRLAQEPERLYKRYLLQGIPFVVHLLGSALVRRVARKKKGDCFHSNIPKSRKTSSDMLAKRIDKGQPYRRKYKRAFDCMIALPCLVLLVPLMGLIALVIKLSSPGPLIFSQKRIGLGGRRFTLYKFRTMACRSESRLAQLLLYNEMDGPVFKMTNDPRVAGPFQKLLRKTGLDELPQLWNVLSGDMSIVGPRPPLPDEVAQYNSYQKMRISVKPGLTCLWQILPRRNKIGFDKWTAMDIEYIETYSFSLDLKIIIRTFPAIILGYGD